MRRFIVLALMVLVPFCAKVVNAGELMLQKGKDGKIGLANEKGDFVLEPVYDDITDFIGGAAMLHKADKWGLVNSEGKIIAPVKYADIKSFNRYSLAQVNVGGKPENGFITGGKLGYINRNGEEVLPAKYTDLGFFDDNGLAWIKSDEKYGLIDITGKLLLPAKYAGYGDMYMISTTGEEFAPSEYAEKAPKVKTEIYWVNVGGKFEGANIIGGTFGYVNRKGEEILPPKYAKVSLYFVDSVAWVQSGSKYGYVDINGKIIVKPEYEAVVDMCNGIGAVRKKQRWAYIDRSGNALTPFKYSFALPFTGEIAAVGEVANKYVEKKPGFMASAMGIMSGSYSGRSSSGKNYIPKDIYYGFIDRTGREIVPLEYDSVSMNSYKGRAFVRQGYRWAYVDKSGKLLTKFFINGFDKLDDGYTRVHIKGDYYEKAPMYNNFINYDGKLLNDKEYHDVSDFSEGYACVKKSSGNCWIDKRGREVFDNGYYHVEDFGDGLAFAYKDGKGRYINNKGEDVFFISLGSEAIGEKFKDGYAYIRIDKKFGCIDRGGSVIIPVELDSRDDVDALFKSVYLMVKRPLNMREVSVYRLYKDTNTSPIGGRVSDDLWAY